uniref:Uncharacterized protein n=1 Tax=Arundo donax TaxID=35708 RepID=A0A0A8ZZ89_ARUDO
MSDTFPKGPYMKLQISTIEFANCGIFLTRVMPNSYHAVHRVELQTDVVLKGNPLLHGYWW